MNPVQDNPWAELSRGSGGEPAEWLALFALISSALGITLIARGFWHARTRGLDATAKWVFLIGLGLLPAFALTAGTGAVIQAAKEPANCMSCHIMESYGEDMMDPASENLAAMHYKNRWIRGNHCYTCHSHYGIFGAFAAKLDGVAHLYHYVTGTYELPLKMREPYPIEHCLQCHGESKAFLDVEKHLEAEVVAELKGRKTSCLECHEAPHPRPEGPEQ